VGDGQFVLLLVIDFEVSEERGVRSSDDLPAGCRGLQGTVPQVAGPHLSLIRLPLVDTFGHGVGLRVDMLKIFVNERLGVRVRAVGQPRGGGRRRHHLLADFSNVWELALMVILVGLVTKPIPVAKAHVVAYNHNGYITKA